MAFINDGDETTLLDVIEYIMDGFFFLDLLISFFSAYVDNNENLVIDRKVFLF